MTSLPLLLSPMTSHPHRCCCCYPLRDTILQCEHPLSVSRPSGTEYDCMPPCHIFLWTPWCVWRSAFSTPATSCHVVHSRIFSTPTAPYGVTAGPSKPTSNKTNRASNCFQYWKQFSAFMIYKWLPCLLRYYMSHKQLAISLQKDDLRRSKLQNCNRRCMIRTRFYSNWCNLIYKEIYKELRLNNSSSCTCTHLRATEHCL